MSIVKYKTSQPTDYADQHVKYKNVHLTNDDIEVENLVS